METRIFKAQIWLCMEGRSTMHNVGEMDLATGELDLTTDAELLATLRADLQEVVDIVGPMVTGLA